MFTMKAGDRNLQVKFHHFQEFDDNGHLEFAQTFCVLQDLNVEPQILGEDFIYNSMYIDNECNTSLCKNKRRKKTLGQCLQELYPQYLEDHKQLRRNVWFEYFNAQGLSRARRRIEDRRSVWQKLRGIFVF